VSLDQIRYFVTVAEEGNITRAARRLHISQPPLTRQIRALEDELGAPLLDHHPKGMSLLPTGQAFLHKAREVLHAVDAATASVSNLPVAERSAAASPERGDELQHRHSADLTLLR
jgi:DNA-binding transcriptional LysR family regulator